MRSILKRNMSRDDLIEQLKIVFSECQVDEFKTKRFKGLLHDRISDYIGLKTRLEIMGQSGTLEKLFKISSDTSRNGQKVEKLASGFSKTYGFALQEVMDTMDLCLKANEVQVDLVVHEPLNLPVGNFSKNHFGPATGNMQVIAKASEPVSRVHQKTNSSYSRNSYNLASMILYLGAMIGFLVYMWMNTDLNLLNPAYLLDYSWALWVVGGIVALVAVAHLFKAIFKYNIVSLYPLMVVAAQIAVAALYRGNISIYNQIQFSFWLVIVASFVPITFPAVKLPRKEKEALAYKAIGSYYLSGIVFFTIQYMTRLFI